MCTRPLKIVRVPALEYALIRVLAIGFIAYQWGSLVQALTFIQQAVFVVMPVQALYIALILQHVTNIIAQIMGLVSLINFIRQSQFAIIFVAKIVPIFLSVINIIVLKRCLIIVQEMIITPLSPHVRAFV